MPAANLPTPSTTGNPIPGSRFTRLNAIGPVGLNGVACLHLHKSWVGCDLCEKACPSHCIKLAPGDVSLDADRCNGCGQCAVACPSDALAVDGFALEDLIGRRTAKSLRIGCLGKFDPTDEISLVPCIGGIAERSLLTILGQAPERQIELLEPSDCVSCARSAGESAPVQRLASSLQKTLTACGHSPERIQVLSQSALPNRNAAKSAAGRPAMGRRSFFSGITRVLSETIVHKTSGASSLLDLASLPKLPRSAINYVGGHVSRLLMMKLAGQTGKALHQARLPAITVTDQCTAQGACVRLCPTGAIQREIQGNTFSLSFDPWRCVDCGACAKACRDGALQFEPPAMRAFVSGSSVVRQVILVECASCGEHFSPTNNLSLCPICRKSSDLSQVGFGLFAGLRNRLPAETGPP